MKKILAASVAGLIAVISIGVTSAQGAKPSPSPTPTPIGPCTRCLPSIPPTPPTN